MKYEPAIFAITGGKKIMGLNPVGIMESVITVRETIKKKESKVENQSRNTIMPLIVLWIMMILAAICCLAFH